jgi:hypothetical protein
MGVNSECHRHSSGSNPTSPASKKINHTRINPVYSFLSWLFVVLNVKTDKLIKICLFSFFFNSLLSAFFGAFRLVALSHFFAFSRFVFHNAGLSIIISDHIFGSSKL